MPPHCDSLDGPVVTAACLALRREDVDLVLPYVKQEGEPEIRAAFELAVKAGSQGPEAHEVADRFFFETVVRVHRAGEGAPFTGLRPAGLDVGPVIPLAEQAIASGSPDELVDFLTSALRREVIARFDAMLAAKAERGVGDVEHERAYVESVLGLQVWAHHLHVAMTAPAHEGHGHG